MASGSSSQQNFRRAICAIKDSTSVGIAKVNSEYKEIKVSVLKATSHVEALPKEKHVRAILGAVSGSRPRADVAYCIYALTKRLAKTRSWVVALKTLIVIHRALREVDHSFCEELIYHNQHSGRLLNLKYFKDDSSPNAWDYSNWICTYALYIEECLECFRVLKYDFYRDHTRTRKFDPPTLFEQLPALQQLLFRLLSCELVGAARHNYMIQYALSIIAAESVRLYVAITDGVLVLVDKFFEMQRRDAVRALEIYRKSGEQAQKLSEFFEMCRSLEFGRRQKYVKIEQPPPSFLKAMEDYVKEAPEQLMLPWTAKDDECVTPKLITASVAHLEFDPNQASSEEESHASDDSQEGAKPDAPPLIPDLLSWDEPSQEASEPEDRNALSLVTATPGLELSSEPASWELALVTTPAPEAPSVTLTKGGVLDRSVLDSLYDAPTNPNTNANANGAFQTAYAPSNPFEVDDYAYNQNMYCNGYPYNQNMYYDPSLVAHPSYMQVQQQGAFMEHQDQEQLMAYNYTQMGGIPQQQPTFTEQQQHYQQESSSFVGNDSTQMTETPQLEASIQQQETSVVGNDSTDKIGNPFEVQSSLPVVPQNQSSDFSFL